MTTVDNSVDAALVERILGEYREMPGLALTLPQARRLWGCDALTCDCVVGMLVQQGRLKWSRDGRLIRPTYGEVS
jgi:hypothetical protein